MPMPIVNPPKDWRFAERPYHRIMMKAINIDRGMEATTTSDDLTFHRKRKITTTMSSAASLNASTTVDTAWLTRSAWS